MSDREIEQLKRRLKEAEAQTKEAKAETKEAKALSEKTTLEEYLRNCHSHVFKALRLADKKKCSTGHATKVVGKRYPLWLRPWGDFADLQQRHFDTILGVLGDRRLFSTPITTREYSEIVSRKPAAFEADIAWFERFAVELPVENILEKLLADPRIRCEFNVTGFRFSNNNSDLKQPSDVGAADAADGEVQERRRSGPSKRLASEQKVEPRTYPDGLGFRRHLGGDEDLAFCFDYKAAHKFTVQDLKPALVREKLFMEVIQQVIGNKTKTDTALKERDDADRQIAMALTQVFDYMIQRGVTYGYVAAGRALVLLHVKLDDVRTLYYHLCVPDEDADVAADDNGHVKVSQTAVAQLASFCLLALRSEVLRGSALEDLCNTAELKRWSEPYDEAEEHLGAGDTDTSLSGPSSQETAASLYEEGSKMGPVAREYPTRSRATCRDTEAVRRRDDEGHEDDEDDGPSRAPALETGSNKRKGGPPSGSSDDGDRSSSSGSDSPPTRQYCTQACLLGLKRGWDLDENCPNVSSHRTVEGGSRHAISADEFTVLVGNRLRQNVYRDCVAVDPYGQAGNIGRIGALFKLELAPYGYTFVAKGTQSAHLAHLRHEGLVYSRLESLQGEVVPVHLGLVDLTTGRGYCLPGEARVVHMMLMSWGGGMAVDAGVPDLAAEQKRSSRAVWHEGVSHGDERAPNMLWNEERRRVMVIDFDQATLRPAVKHKRLSTLSVCGKKRKQREAFPS